MKRIFFGSDGKPPRRPFWQPWGAGGWFLRLFGFLLLLGLLVVLLTLLRRCDDIPPSLLEAPEQDTVAVDTTGLQSRNDIPSPGPYLPSPGDNRLDPISPGDLVDNPDDGRQYVAGVFNVMLDSGADDETFRRWSREFKQAYPDSAYKVAYYDPLTKLMQVKVPQQHTQQVMADVERKITDVEFLAFPEGLMGSWGKPSDPGFSNPNASWYFAPIQAFESWDMTTGSSDVTVAVVDTYFDLNHPEINSSRVVKPYSVINRNHDVLPPRNPSREGYNRQEIKAMLAHGTTVASLAVGNAGNRAGNCGIAPGCRFMPVSLGTRLTSMTMLQGLLYSIYQGADVVNISAGTEFPREIISLPPDRQLELSRNTGLAEEKVWEYAFRIADERKVTVVWAAGNQNSYCALDPSKRGANTVKVSSVNRSLRKAPFSCYGNFPSSGVYESTVSAPGTDIFGAIPGRFFSLQDGTSFSAPITAGAIALMKSVNPELTNPQIVEILRQTGKPVAGSKSIGPVIQIRAALDKARAARS